MKSLIAFVNSVASSVYAAIFIGLFRSRLKIPIIDLASITYLPDSKSMSKLKPATISTKSFTSLIELNLMSMECLEILPDLSKERKMKRSYL